MGGSGAAAARTFPYVLPDATAWELYACAPPDTGA